MTRTQKLLNDIAINKKILVKYNKLKWLYYKADNPNMLDPLDEYSKLLKEIHIVKADIDNLKQQWCA